MRTPEPWEYTEFLTDVTHTLDDGYIAIVADCAVSSRISESECNDNARLIAASPVLLRTLKMARGVVMRLRELIADAEGEAVADAETRQYLNDIDSAIEMAEGKQETRT